MNGPLALTLTQDKPIKSMINVQKNDIQTFLVPTNMLSKLAMVIQQLHIILTSPSLSWNQSAVLT